MNTAIRNVMLPLDTNYSSDNLEMGVIQGAKYCRIQVRLRVSDHPNTRKMTLKIPIAFSAERRFTNPNCCKHRATITKIHRLATLGDPQSSARSDK